MPKAPTLRSNTFEDMTPFLAGWGDTEFRKYICICLYKFLPLQGKLTTKKS